MRNLRFPRRYIQKNDLKTKIDEGLRGTAGLSPPLGRSELAEPTRPSEPNGDGNSKKTLIRNYSKVKT